MEHELFKDERLYERFHADSFPLNFDFYFHIWSDQQLIFNAHLTDIENEQSESRIFCGAHFDLYDWSRLS